MLPLLAALFLTQPRTVNLGTNTRETHSLFWSRPNTLWSFLTPYKSAAQNIQRVSLVSEMLRNPDLARFVASLLPNALKEQQQQHQHGNKIVHRTLLAFNAATLNEFIRRSRKMDEGTGVLLVSALLEPLQVKGGDVSKDAIVSRFSCLSSHFLQSLSLF